MMLAVVLRAQVLKPHQLEGVRWLFGAIAEDGRLLADDPGLGKTLQLITVLHALIRAGLAHRVASSYRAPLHLRLRCRYGCARCALVPTVFVSNSSDFM